MADEKLVVAAGIYDCLGARLAEAAGFKAITVQGSGESFCILGHMDVGLLTMTEIVTHNRNIANSVNIPLLADADTGYGGIIHIQRTVREFEQAGIACVRLEDQVYPFSASHNEKGAMRVCSKQEMVMRIKAALDTREDPDLVICARTDASCISLDEAISRCNAYAEAGADLVMPIMPRDSNLETFKAVAERIHSPLWVLVNPWTKSITPKDLEAVGVRGVMSFSAHVQMATSRIMQILFEELIGGETGEKTLAWLGPWVGENLGNLMGLPKLIDVEKRFPIEKSKD